jgi:hypothetical protein
MRSLVSLTLALLVAGPLARPAEALEAVLLPPGPLSADGIEVHAIKLFLVEGGALVPGLPTVRAQKGALVGAPELEPDGGVLLRYRPPRVDAPTSDLLSVAARGTLTRLALPLEPTGRVQLTLSVTPSPLVLGAGASATVRVAVRDAGGRPARAPLRLGASVGRVSRPVETAPGEYQATYTPPEERFPQVAILAAQSVADGAFAAAPCRMSAPVQLGGVGEPGASMRIAVDGREFGPVVIGADGHFSLPLVVPPGGRAIGTSTDAMGNQQRREIDLRLPPFPRLLIAAVPPELPADGRSRADVVVFAVDARGNPERRGVPPLSADRGQLGEPQAHGDGSTTWRFTAPAQLGSGAAVLRAGAVTTRIALRPGPATRLDVQAPKEPLGAGAEVARRVEVRVRDASGSPVIGARLEAQVAGGHVAGIEELGDGAYALSVVPPRDPGRGTTQLHVEVAGLRAGAPRRVTLHPVAAPAGRLAAEAWIDDDLGLPVAGAAVDLDGPSGTVHAESDRFGTARIEMARPPPEVRRFRVTARPEALPGLQAALDYLVVGEKIFTVASVIGHGRSGAVEPPALASVDAQLPLRPAADVDVRIDSPSVRPRAGEAARLRVRLTDALGRPADGQILAQASGGYVALVGPLVHGVGELEFKPPGDARPGARFVVSVTEARTRVTAFTEVIVR